MKVYIGPYKNWFGPYQIAEKILFWRNKDMDDSVHELGEKLSKSNLLVAICKYIDSKKKRKVQVRIDKYDTWSMDYTLAHIILPMLKQLKETKHGAPFVVDDDVPTHLRSTAAPTKENVWDVDALHFDRWDWVMGEMIFAFESKLTDWQDQFWKEYPEIDFTEYPEDEGQLTKPIRWKKEGECDWAGYDAYQARIQKGFELFGKYYQGLWS